MTKGKHKNRNNSQGNILPLELVYHITTNPAYSITAEEQVNVLKNNLMKTIEAFKE